MLTKKAKHTTTYRNLPILFMRLEKYDKATLSIPKGHIIHIPILAVNTDKEIWGDDAGEFK
jgi:hypothetical protein